MEILRFIQRTFVRLLGLVSFGRLGRDHLPDADRMCQFGHPVFSETKLCNYGHRAA